MSYSFDSRVRYSELDSTGKMPVQSIVNYFQDCSTFHSEDVGHGMNYLISRKRVWVMSGWQIDILRAPQLGEEIEISTWPYAFKGFIGNRNFLMKTKSGEVLACANSIWSFLSTETGLPVKIQEEDIAGYGSEAPYDMEYAPRRISVPKEGERKEPFVIAREHLDTNHHVNNGQYLVFAMRYIPEDFAVRRLRAEYKQQTFLGQKLIPVVSRIEHGFVITLLDENDKICNIVEVTDQI